MQPGLISKNDCAAGENVSLEGMAEHKNFEKQFHGWSLIINFPKNKYHVDPEVEYLLAIL